eukprot:TRINITY_DN14293_c0_g3_i2.p1 TRINITY_DN14293_c0_g3~~TRINITY_DN14293_c0_g3_i2.p1  ORF type:complete len:1006 (+),score=225.32 TRINITY_DN14293_c0_g3_i2:175-3192(+)
MRAAKAVRDVQELSAELAQFFSTLFPNNGQGGGAREYFEVSVLPELKAIAEALCREQPTSPESFLVLWLAERLLLPAGVLSELRALFNKSQTEAEKLVAVSPPPGVAPSRPLACRSSRLGSGDNGSLARPNGSLRPSFASSNSFDEHSVDVKSGEEDNDTVGDLITPSRARRTSAPSQRRRSRLSRRSSSSMRSDIAISAPPKAEVLELLRTVPLLAKYSSDELERVADIAVPQRFEMGEIIMHSGEVSFGLHIITHGVGCLSEPRQIGQLEVGQFFGEQSLQVVGGAPAGRQVQALGDYVTTLSVPRIEFEALCIRRNIERRAKMMRVVGRRSSKEPHSEQSTLTCDVAAPDDEDRCEVTGLKHVQDFVKTQGDLAFIAKAVRGNTVLNEVMALSDEQCSMMADAVHLVEVSAGSQVFSQGDAGSAFFIVHAGYFNVHLAETTVQLKEGDTFGETALMYDEPQGATVEAIVDGKLWVLPRSHFRNVCQISTQRRNQEISSLLQAVPALAASVDASHFEFLATVVEETVFMSGDDVCAAGDDDGTLFIIYEGECTCFRGDGTGDERILTKGQWCGEEALVNREPADVNVIVRTDVAKVLILDHDIWQVAVEATKGLRENQDSPERPVSPSLNSESVAHNGEARGSKFRTQLQNVLSRIKAMSRLRSVSDGAAKTAPRCEIIGALGEGSFGTVLLAREKDSKREYALKVVDKEHTIMENAEDMLKNEKNMLSLVSSDFVIRLSGAFQDADNVFFFLEACFGGELFDVYTDNRLWGKLPHARFYLASVALGLSHLHAKRIVWRDLKLENCLLDAQGYLKLTDMGIAKLVVGVTYTLCGTADYFAPETLRRQGHNRAADWWACGVLLFIMIAGRSPFDAPEVQQIYRNIVKGIAKVEFPSTCPQDAKDVILALCRKKPQDRVTMQKGGINNLKSMRFFDGINWDDLLARKCEPPFIPAPFDYEKARNRKLSKPIEIDWNELMDWSPDPIEPSDDQPESPHSALAFPTD